MTQWKKHSETSPDNTTIFKATKGKKIQEVSRVNTKRLPQSPFGFSCTYKVQYVFRWLFVACVCACVCVLVYCVQYNGWHGNILKSYKHLVVVAVYYCLKFAVNDLYIKIFKQIYFVWEQCLSNSNFTLVGGSNGAQSLRALQFLRGFIKRVFT